MSLLIKECCAGAIRIESHNEGQGEKLVFENIPYLMSRVILEEVSGLYANYPHPLRGTTYCTDNHKNTFTLTVYASELDAPLAQTFAKWSMSDMYKPYASDETKTLLYAD